MAGLVGSLFEVNILEEEEELAIWRVFRNAQRPILGSNPTIDSGVDEKEWHKHKATPHSPQKRTPSYVHEFYEKRDGYFVCKLCLLDPLCQPTKFKDLGRRTGTGTRWNHILKTSHHPHHIGELNISVGAELAYREKLGLNVSDPKNHQTSCRPNATPALDCRRKALVCLSGIREKFFLDYSEFFNKLVSGI